MNSKTSHIKIKDFLRDKKILIGILAVGIVLVGGWWGWEKQIEEKNQEPNNNTSTIDDIQLVVKSDKEVYKKGTENLFCYYSNLDCPEKMKCENNICVDVGCLKEGEYTHSRARGPGRSGFLRHVATQCCEGLKEIITDYDENCNIPEFLVGATGVHIICSNCGNGNCEKWENKCNCPEDCESSPLVKIPSAPWLTSPQNQTMIDDSIITFSWRDYNIGAAEKYLILIDNASDFSSPEIEKYVEHSQFKPENPLSDGKHYWRVRAIYETGEQSEWSNVSEITIFTVSEKDRVTVSTNKTEYEKGEIIKAVILNSSDRSIFSHLDRNCSGQSDGGSIIERKISNNNWKGQTDAYTGTDIWTEIKPENNYRCVWDQKITTTTGGVHGGFGLKSYPVESGVYRIRFFYFLDRKFENSSFIPNHERCDKATYSNEFTIK